MGSSSKGSLSGLQKFIVIIYSLALVLIGGHDLLVDKRAFFRTAYDRIESVNYRRKLEVKETVSRSKESSGGSNTNSIFARFRNYFSGFFSSEEKANSSGVKLKVDEKAESLDKLRDSDRRELSDLIDSL